MENNKFQDRYLISLDKTEGGSVIRKILKSPNELAVEVIKILFNKSFDENKEKLDSIKKFVAGITRAESFSGTYKLANYYTYLFSFNQFFHSSYRARQGKALEELLAQILIECGSSFYVADKTKQKIELIKEVFPEINSKLDLDAVCRKNDNHYLVVQLRSRDDTGGTTAKASLVDFLKKSFEWKKEEGKNLLYLVVIWDEINNSQKKITKSKMYSSLSHLIEDKYTEEDFINSVEEGIDVRDNVTLKMVYGKTILSNTLAEWTKPEAKISENTISDMIKKVQNWDDLWLSYSIASLELDNYINRGFSNVDILGKYVSEKEIKKIISSKDIIFSSNEMALSIAPSWKEKSIPAESLSEKIHYIRDLILLRCIYEIS